jgi:hypothetical protein
MLAMSCIFLFHPHYLLCFNVYHQKHNEIINIGHDNNKQVNKQEDKKSNNKQKQYWT